MSEVGTTAPDLLLVAFEALSADEQDEAFERLSAARLRRLAGEHSATETALASLRRVTVELGEAPSPDAYKEVRERLRASGEELEPLSRIIRHFGSWRRAKEALQLSGETTPRRIEARFRSRRLGKVWRYTEKTLCEVLRRCAQDLGHVPQVAEFEWWRDRELELAAAQGNDALHLPSAGPYRRRYGSWEQALLRFGYTPDEVAERLERGREGEL